MVEMFSSRMQAEMDSSQTTYKKVSEFNSTSSDLLREMGDF